MAAPTTLKWHELLFKVGDGSPVDFDALGEPCGLIAKTLTMTNGSNEFSVPDCDTPELASWLTREVQSKSLSIGGTAVFNDVSWDTVWRPWFFTTTTNEKTLRILFNKSTMDSYGYVQGDFIIESNALSADRDAEGGLVRMEISLLSTGEQTWTSL